MYLLHTTTYQLHRFLGSKVPPYVILSHTWSEDGEVLFQDISQPQSYYTQLQGFPKISKCCALARSDGWEYVWIDNCCIDQKSSAELSEAINSMYRWYRDAEACYAYLADISVAVGRADAPRRKLRESRWFTRGWTLQELLAPEVITFYDRDWIDVGTKRSLQHWISDATGIDTVHLFEPGLASAAATMSWASFRETTRPEDIAYCLLGLFNVNMPLLYGEGATKAFERLQNEVIRSGYDESIFAWLMPMQYKGRSHGGMLAPSPEYFSRSGNIVRIATPDSFGPRLTLTSSGISLAARFQSVATQRHREREYEKAGYGYLRTEGALYTVPLGCANKEHRTYPLKLHLEELMPQQVSRLLPYQFDYMAEGWLCDSNTRIFHVSRTLFNEDWLKPPKRPFKYPSALTIRLSLEAQGRLSFRGVDWGTSQLLSTMTADDGRLTVKAARTSTVHFQHARDFMIRVTYEKLNVILVHIERELICGGDAQPLSVGIEENISIPLGDEEVLWMSSRHGCDQIGDIVIVDVDTTSKDKLDRESIL